MVVLFVVGVATLVNSTPVRSQSRRIMGGTGIGRRGGSINGAFTDAQSSISNNPIVYKINNMADLKAYIYGSLNQVYHCINGCEKCGEDQPNNNDVSLCFNLISYFVI